VRRHARLVDYFMHDGGNARVWVQLRAAPGVSHARVPAVHEGRKTRLLTRVEGLPTLLPMSSPMFARALSAQRQVFELMDDVDVFEAHNEMKFYTWGALECCLPKGATRATLSGAYPRLEKGHVLIFEEVRGTETGSPDEADAAHRHAVRLTRVTVAE